MAEYIEREALIEFVKQNTPNINGETTIECVERAIRTHPTADVVEVIRCKDCAYYGGITFGNICRRWSALNVKNCTKPDDFCSYGERKDGDEECLNT